MCSHPEFDDEMLPLSKGDALEGATLREGDICGRTAIPPNARNTQNIAAEYILNKTTSIRVGRYEHLRRSMRMTKVGSMQKKREGVNEGKEEREAEEGGV